MTVTFCFFIFVTWLSVFRIEEEKKTKIAEGTCSDRLVNLNLILCLQIFLTHTPLSIPTAVTMCLFVIQMSNVGAIQMYFSYPVLSQYI